MTPEQGRRYRFGEFTLDTARACLLRGEQRIELRPKAFDALRYLLEHHGRLVTKDELIRALWPAAVVTDDSLVKCIQDVRRAVDDGTHRLVRTVPRRGYMLELPAGPAADGPAGPDPAASPATRAPGAPRAVMAGIGALAMLAAGATWYWTREAGPRPAVDSVAVLPFENLSADLDNDYFAAGVHESILNQLVRIGNLETIARTSMLRYADTDKPIAEIARELNVQAVVAGSVQHAGDRVRVTAQLIDPETDMHLWSEEYDRPLVDIFDIQTDIATRIAEALHAELSSAETTRIRAAPTRSTDAYELYLRGRYHYDKSETADLRKSIQYFERAIRIAPDFALAYAGIADAYMILDGLGAAPPAELVPRAREAVDTALAIDPNLAEAYVARAMIRYFYDWEYSAGNADFEWAIELNPNLAIAHHLFGKNLVTERRFDEALAKLDRALALDPYSASVSKDIGETLLYANRIEEAVIQFRRTEEIDPGSLPVRFWLLRCFEALGQTDRAVENHLALYRSSRWSNIGPMDIDASERVYRDSGWTAYWTEWLALLGDRAKHRHVEPFRLAEAAMRAGDHDAAVHWLERAVEIRSAWVPTMHIDPLLAPLDGDPRFEALLRRARLH
jgi:TolB-like protein/DNA-binding winged helix-turn-helix (wHTH) protein